jgi:hypothetical protein
MATSFFDHESPAILNHCPRIAKEQAAVLFFAAELFHGEIRLILLTLQVR